MTEFRPTRFEVLPTIIKNLLIINGLMFLAQNTFAGPTSTFSFEDYFALLGVAFSEGSNFKDAELMQ